MNFWDFLVWAFWVYIIISCISIFITVFIDVFRDQTLSGLGKAGWVIFLILLPFLAAFIYLIARGRSMAQRGAERQRAAYADANAYARSAVPAGTGGASEIEAAKKLLDSGAITDAEYAQLKAKALA